MLDFFAVGGLLTPEQGAIQQTMRQFVDAEVTPGVRAWWDEHTFPLDLVPKLAALGVFGANLPEEYGGAGLDNVAYGLIMYELERGDSGLRSFASVQSGLVMFPINAYGSKEQRDFWIPKLA